MDSVAQFRHRRLDWPKARKRRRARRRLRGARWISMVVIIAAAAGVLLLDQRATGFVGQGPFRLCSWAAGQNCVIDGDTIRYQGVKIRIEDLNAPETHEPQCAAEAERGRRATRRLLELMNDGPFRVVQTGWRDEDRYGRKLRVIERNGRSISETLIAEGLARPWTGARHGWCG